MDIEALESWRELRRYYARELDYLRRASGAFAAGHPRAAANLGLGGSAVADPHVQVMLESFAYLTARLQRDLDDEQARLGATLLEILGPLFTAPLPSMSIASFEPASEGGGPRLIEAGTALRVRDARGRECRFRTCYPVEILPLRVAGAGIEGAGADGPDEAVSAIVVRLESSEGPVARLAGPRPLRFFLAGEDSRSARLADLLLGDLVAVAARTAGADASSLLPAPGVQLVGLEPNEAALPRTPGTPWAHALVQEHFLFPEKLRFVDVGPLPPGLAGEAIELVFYLRRPPDGGFEPEGRDFRLGCTPIVNIFERVSEAIALDERQHEYELVADAQHRETTEIHSVLEVFATEAGKPQLRSFAPFFGGAHQASGRRPTAWWHATRRPAEREALAGTETWLSLYDPGVDLSGPSTREVYARVLCTNRDVAAQLPEGAELETGDDPDGLRITCLKRPTPQVDPIMNGAALWQLVSLLTASRGVPDTGREGLIDALRLFRSPDPARFEAQLEGIAELRARPVSRAIREEAWRGMCRGLEIRLVFDERYYGDTSILTFAAVLERFLAARGPIASFTELAAEGRNRKGTWRRWKPRAGTRTLPSHSSS